jgi:hypothetical protein
MCVCVCVYVCVCVCVRALRRLRDSLYVCINSRSHVWTCMHVFIYVFKCVCMYAYVYVYTYIHICISTYLHSYIHTRMYTYMYTYTYTYITYIHKYIYIYIHIYIYTHTTNTHSGGTKHTHKKRHIPTYSAVPSTHQHHYLIRVIPGPLRREPSSSTGTGQTRPDRRLPGPSSLSTVRDRRP